MKAETPCFNPGDIIECIEAGVPGLEFGHQYEVEWAGEHPSANRSKNNPHATYYGVKLKGIKKGRDNYPYGVNLGKLRFRLVQSSGQLSMPDTRDYLIALSEFNT